MVKVPTTASAFRELGEVHLRGGDILNHCMETDQGSVRMSIRRVVERERWDLLSNLKHKSLGVVAYNGRLPVGWNPVYERR